jgi:DNA-binding transcriptional LysR family regulator
MHAAAPSVVGGQWRVTFESASLDAVLAAVQLGLGMAALPTESIRTGKLHRVNRAALPTPPRIQFGLCRNAPLLSEAGTLLEVTVDSVFRNSTEVLVV